MKVLPALRLRARHAGGLILAVILSATAHAGLLAGLFAYSPPVPLDGGPGGLGVEITLAGPLLGVKNAPPGAAGTGAGPAGKPAPVETAKPGPEQVKPQAAARAAAEPDKLDPDRAVKIATLTEERKPEKNKTPKQTAETTRPERARASAKPQKPAPPRTETALGSGPATGESAGAAPGERPGPAEGVPTGSPSGALDGSPTGAGPGGGTGKAEPLGSVANPKPAYPEIARQRGQEGAVVLLVDVTAEGTAQQVTVRRSSGYDMLDDAAVKAVRRWRFKPARLAGMAVAGQALVPIEFRLQ